MIRLMLQPIRNSFQDKERQRLERERQRIWKETVRHATCGKTPKEMKETLANLNSFLNRKS